MPEPEDASAARSEKRLSNADLISRAAEALNPQMLAEGFWVADVGAAVEAEDGQVFTGACIGGHLSICAELGALSQLVATTTPIITRMVAVWRNPADAVLHVIPPCGRCREFIRTMSQQNLEATVILGPDHTTTLRDLLPYAGWHAEQVHARGPLRQPGLMDHQPAREHAFVVIRPYEPSDAAETLAVFISAVAETASADYTTEQVQAWAQPERRDVGTWHAAMLARNSIVATVGGELAGFSDLSPDGYVDMMFVSPRHQRRGVARQLLAHVEAQARSEATPGLSTDASITARPFFERHGFTVEAEQHPVKAGVELTNYKMRKAL